MRMHYHDKNESVPFRARPGERSAGYSFFDVGIAALAAALQTRGRVSWLEALMRIFTSTMWVCW